MGVCCFIKKESRNDPTLSLSMHPKTHTPIHTIMQHRIQKCKDRFQGNEILFFAGGMGRFLERVGCRVKKIWGFLFFRGNRERLFVAFRVNVW